SRPGLYPRKFAKNKKRPGRSRGARWSWLATRPPHARQTGAACLQIDAEADAGRTFAAAEGAAERERRAPDALAVADRQASLAALETGADRDAAALALSAGGVDRHVQHRRAHRTHAIDAAILLVEAAIDVVEAVLERGDAPVEFAGVEADQLLDGDVGVRVGRVQRCGVAGGHVVADRDLAIIRIARGLVEGRGVTCAGDVGGDGGDLRLVQPVETTAGRSLRPGRPRGSGWTSRAGGTSGTGRTSRSGGASWAGRTAAGRLHGGQE